MKRRGSSSDAAAARRRARLKTILFQDPHTAEQETTGKAEGQMVEAQSHNEEVRHGERPD